MQRRERPRLPFRCAPKERGSAGGGPGTAGTAPPARGLRAPLRPPRTAAPPPPPRTPGGSPPPRRPRYSPPAGSGSVETEVWPMARPGGAHAARGARSLRRGCSRGHIPVLAGPALPAGWRGAAAPAAGRRLLPVIPPSCPATAAAPAPRPRPAPPRHRLGPAWPGAAPGSRRSLRNVKIKNKTKRRKSKAEKPPLATRSLPFSYSEFGKDGAQLAGLPPLLASRSLPPHALLQSLSPDTELFPPLLIPSEGTGET